MDSSSNLQLKQSKKLQCFSSHPRSPTCAGWRRLSPLENPLEDNFANIIPVRPVLSLHLYSLRKRNQVKARESKLACPGKDLSHLMMDGMLCGDTRKLNTLVNPFLHVDSSRNQSTSDIPYDSQERSWNGIWMVPSTHRSEPAPPVKRTERNFQSFHSRATDAVAYTPQEHRLLGEEDMHVRNSEIDQL